MSSQSSRIPPSLLDDIVTDRVERGIKAGVAKTARRVVTTATAEQKEWLARQVTAGSNEKAVKAALKAAAKQERKEAKERADKRGPNEEKRPPEKRTVLVTIDQEWLGQHLPTDVRVPWQAVVHNVTENAVHRLTEPRGDLPHDASLWRLLLTQAYAEHRNGGDSGGINEVPLFERLIVARILGATLVRTGSPLSGPIKLRPRIDQRQAIAAWPTERHWASYRDNWLVPYQEEIKELLEWIR